MQASCRQDRKATGASSLGLRNRRFQDGFKFMQGNVLKIFVDAVKLTRLCVSIPAACENEGSVDKLFGPLVEKNDSVSVALIHPLVQLEIDRRIAPSIAGHDDLI